MGFAKIREVNEGDTLIADGGFTCIKSGAEVTVRSSAKNELYVPCADGRHYLDGQIDGDEYIGLTKKS